MALPSRCWGRRGDSYGYCLGLGCGRGVRVHNPGLWQGGSITSSTATITNTTAKITNTTANIATTGTVVQLAHLHAHHGQTDM